jgi:PAS domain S-box-containing protein
MKSLRFGAVWPPVFALILLLLFVVFRPLLDTNFSTFLLIGIAACLVATVVTTEFRLRRPLVQLINQSNSGPASNDLDSVDEISQVATIVASLKNNLSMQETKLREESELRLQLQEALGESETRYALAVERANDGNWDWDLQSGAIELSPRWQSLFGLLSADAPTHIDDWRRLVHPDDNEAVLMRLQNHIEGLTPHFNAEFRMRHRDGSYRWIHSRGTALRHANGKSYRMIFLDSDIHDRKALEETIVRAAEGLSSVSGEEFFHRLMINLSTILGTRDNLVCYCVDDPPTRAHTLAYYRNGIIEENFEYDLEGTSCGAVIARKEIVYCPTGVCDIWPFEKQFDRDSYLGVPMFDSRGKIIGHFACMDGKPMRQDLPRLEIFKIFAVRAAAELERLLLTRQISIQNHATGN